MDENKQASFYAKIIAIGLVVIFGIYFGIQAIQTRVKTNALFSNYSVSIPSNWSGSYEVEKKDTVTTIWYTKDPNKKAVIFEIKALTRSDWAARKMQDIRSNEITSKDDVVFIYSTPSDNPYTGQMADEYQKMKSEVPFFINTFKITE